jgi:hypothetical protein
MVFGTELLKPLSEAQCALHCAKYKTAINYRYRCRQTQAVDTSVRCGCQTPLTYFTCCLRTGHDGPHLLWCSDGQTGFLWQEERRWLSRAQRDLHCARYNVEVRVYDRCQNKQEPMTFQRCSCGSRIPAEACILQPGHAGPCLFWCFTSNTGFLWQEEYEINRG